MEHGMHTYDMSPKLLERAYWASLVRTQQLDVFDSVCSYMDLHRFGQVLRDVHWQLKQAQSKGLIKDLAYFYRMGASTEFSPSPEERILVLNDGIARVVDFPSGIVMNAMTVFVRDLIVTHCQLVYAFRNSRLGLGVRTVLAGGERIQYAPSLEPHTEEGEAIEADNGERIDWNFGQQTVFNPFHFQMNTAFSRAYLIEKAGRREGILRNRIYIDEMWLQVWLKTFGVGLRVKNEGTSGSGTIIIHFGRFPWLALEFDATLEIRNKDLGDKTTVYQLSQMREYKNLDSNESTMPLTPNEMIREFEKRKANGWPGRSS